MNKWTATLKTHWRFIAFEFSLLLGGLLILNAFRFVPYIIDSVFTKFQPAVQSGSFSLETSSQPFSADTNFNQYFPFFSQIEVDRIGFQSTPEETPFFEAVNFLPGAAQISLRIFQKGEIFSSDQPVAISFLPGDRCVFGDGRACIYEFETASGARVVFASIHSGLDAEAEAFRDLVEGTGSYQALYNEEKIRLRLQALAGAKIKVAQGESQIEGLSLSTVVRIPPEHMADYMQTPVEELLDFAVEINALNSDLLSQDLLVFETCGWRLPGEMPVPGVPDTSTSVYLGVIGMPDS